ncbi:hypothetical protein Celaphus_00012682 [Cervus elaphus hippelaphus]|uniref:Peptidase A1 domain-containing protein n=1 Tax=Cervus elaphus hippelaphus TaxID=46360 RepID=A0A212CIY9_CEREH|nr:hypothetical protein Celaphus_00012682 [Cervus elaphus hippelaphus]
MLRTRTCPSTWSQERSMKWLVLLGLVVFSECIVKTNGKAIVNPQAEEFSFQRCKNHSRKKLLNPYSIPSPTSRICKWDHSSLPQIGELVSTDQPFILNVNHSGFEGKPFDGYPPQSSLYRGKPEGSVVMFGGVDESYYQGALNRVPLIQAGNWHDLHGKIYFCCNAGFEALVDTRTSLIIGP